MKHFPVQALTWALLLAVAGMLLPGAAFADSPSATCTYNPQFNIPMPAAGTGIISILVQNVSTIVNNIAQVMYTSLVGNISFQIAVRAALTVYVIMYGIMFIFGLSQISFMDFLLRMTKFAIVAALISPYSWLFFFSYVGVFFHYGTDWLIGVMGQIAVGTVPGLNPLQPFAVLDNAIAILTSSKMAVTLIATFFTGPYGIIFGMMILMGLGTFGAALFQAMWVYLMSLVVRAFLFALAPIFFTFLLFNRTRHLFDGWVNQLLSASLQPIFLFTFFAFFAKLVEAALQGILRVPVCWTPPGRIWQGTPFDIHIWRFMVNQGGTWQMYGGAWSFTGADFAGAPVFPLGLVDILIFLLLVQLAWRFNGIVTNIAKDIAGASLSLNISGNMSEWMNPVRGRQQALGQAGERASGGGRGRGGGAAGVAGLVGPRPAPGTGPAPGGAGGAGGAPGAAPRPAPRPPAPTT